MPPPLKVDGKGKGHNFIDYSGKYIGNIKLFYPVDKAKDGHILYLAQCYCGNFFIIRPQRLKSGNTKSCGCYKHEKTIERNHKKTEEIIGTFCGNLEVLNFSEYRNYLGVNKAFYKCLCHNCGSISYHCGSDLKNGSITSCGCVLSRKEEELKKLFSLYNIQYKSQYSFSDLVNPETNTRLRFDFAIFKEKKIYCLIEYQGQQHYDHSSPWHSLSLEKRDALKKVYCKNNNIKLIELNKTNDLLLFVEKLKNDLEEGEAYGGIT